MAKPYGLCESDRDRVQELHHYTTRAGLEGIVESGAILATFNGARNILEANILKPSLMASIVSGMLSKEDAAEWVSNIAFKVQQAPHAHAAALEAVRMIEILYHLAFQYGSSKADTVKVEMKPYIVSFCSHQDDSAYERENGLLSQWRRYSGVGGFCLVFDTDKLMTLLRNEVEKYHFYSLSAGGVLYSDNAVAILTVCADALSFLDETKGVDFDLVDDFDEVGSDAARDALFRFYSNAVRFKQQAFKEEREFRISVTPVREIDALHKPKLIEAQPTKRFKEIGELTTRDSDVTYLRLFESCGTPLPIKRIIVGPAADQHKNLAADRRVLGKLDVPIVLSATPFIY